MALITQDQFFELWYPTTYWGPENTPNARNNARNSPNGSRQFAAAWEAYNRDQIAAENPRSVLDTPYTFNEPAPSFTQWSGPCYDANCQRLRASIESSERANYAAWQTRKAQAEAAEQKRLYEVALLQEADVKAQQFEAEEAAKFLASEQQKLQQDLVFEQQRINEQKQQEQAKIEAQINAARLATEQEMATIKTQFETEKTANEKKIAEAIAETARQELITKKQTAIQQKAASTPATNLMAQQSQQTASTTQKQRRKSMIGQPGVSVTRVSARSGVGGYGGTAPTRINPTGLNI
jgi:hypothetical protein